MPVPLASTRAFTLLELMVALVLVTIVISLAVPRLSSFLFSDQLKGVTRKLVGLINEGAQRSERGRQPHLITFSSAKRQFILEPEKLEEGKEALKVRPTVRLPETVVFKGMTTFFAGSRQPGEAVIRFSERGYVEPAVIYLQDETGKEMSVVLSPFLGRVQVAEGRVELESNNGRR